jgi:hypothetical protein
MGPEKKYSLKYGIILDQDFAVQGRFSNVS